MMDAGIISGKIAKEVLDVMFVEYQDQQEHILLSSSSPSSSSSMPVLRSPAQIVLENDWAQVTDVNEITDYCQQVLGAHPQEIDKYFAKEAEKVRMCVTWCVLICTRYLYTYPCVFAG